MRKSLHKCPKKDRHKYARPALSRSTRKKAQTRRCSTKSAKLVAVFKRAVMKRNHMEGRKALRKARRAGYGWAWSK